MNEFKPILEIRSATRVEPAEDYRDIEINTVEVRIGGYTFVLDCASEKEAVDIGHACTNYLMSAPFEVKHEG